MGENDKNNIVYFNTGRKHGRMRHKRYGAATVLLCFLFIFYVCISWNVEVFAAKEDEAQTVRIGYVISENFQEGEKGKPKYGYGYEYLQKISYYTGWKYEYVYGSFEDLFLQLENGEIDLMSDISYTDERAKKISFSSKAQGEEFFYIYTQDGETKYDCDHLSTLNGAKVGVISDCNQKTLFKSWCKEQNVKCEIIEYNSEKKRTSDLKNGVIDLIISTDMDVADNTVPLIQIGKEPFYYGVAKTSDKILKQLNHAMEEIQTEFPFYNEQLRMKYMSSTVVHKRLSAKEKEWLQEKQSITVGYLKDYMPYCGSNAQGELTGMLKDYLDNLQKKYSVRILTRGYRSYNYLKEALAEGKVDVIFPAYGEYCIGEEENLMLSDAVTTSSMTVVNGGENEKEVERIAVCSSDPFQMVYASIYYPDAKQEKFDSLEDCLEAVSDEKVEFTIVETAKINEFSNLKYKKKVQKTDLQVMINISFAVERGDTTLLSIVNKAVGVTDDSFVTNSLIYHTQENLQYTVFDFFSGHIYIIVFIIILIFGIILANIIAYFNLKLKSQKRLMEMECDARSANWKAEHDAGTGLLNRAAFQSLTQKLMVTERPMAILVFDVDKFKKINDTYGHEMGDQALIKIANLLTQQFRSDDYVIRYAGDEFVVLAINATLAHSDAITAKIDRMNHILQNPDDHMPKLSVSVGIAYAVEGYEEELFHKADQALYYTKEHGRCGYAIYERLKL
jgi:diguanylate cyclase (GGDEF)-like protein